MQLFTTFLLSAMFWQHIRAFSGKQMMGKAEIKRRAMLSDILHKKVPNKCLWLLVNKENHISLLTAFFSIFLE